MNERDIPSVPITTLAGVASLTDLLPVLPLPTPLPSTLNNKSQLFHPRVAEEAAILLATRDDNLVSLLLQSLMQTSVQHIDLKDESIPNAVSPAPQQSTPELLKAILHVNPNVFDQQQRNHWGNHLHTAKFNGMSPSSTYNYSSNNTTHSSPTSHGTAVHPSAIPNQQLLAAPCQSSPHVNMGSPPSQARPGSQVNITAQNNVSPPWNTSNQSNIYSSPLSNTSNPQNGGYYNSLVQDNRNFGTNLGEDKDPLSMSPSNMSEEQKQLLQSQDKSYEQDGNVVTGQSPAQASVAPSPLRQEPQVPQPSMGAPYAPTQDKLDPRSTTLVNNRFPVVKLGRLSEGLLKKHELPNDERMRKNSTVESDSDDNMPLKAKSSNSTPAVDKEKEAIDIAREKNWEAVKRKHEAASKKEEEEAAIVRPKLRKVERRLVPVLEMLSVDELMETNTYQRFNKLIDSVFETIDDDVIITEEMEGTDIPEDLLLPRYQLQELCAEAAKLKNLGAMEAIPADRLVRLLNILEKNIRAAEKMSLVGDPDDSEEMRQIWMESALERVMCASDACLTALYIMTSPSMPKRIFLEDVIDRIVMFIKFQLNNTIYCVYDPVYSIQSTSKKKGWYTTITLAVYGNLSQVLPDTPTTANPPPNIQRPVSREVGALPANVPQSSDWNPEPTNPIPAYTTNVVPANPENYGAGNYPENYDNQMYRGDYYDNEAPKVPRDPRSYHHIEDSEWEKDRRDVSCERDGDRIRHSPRSMELERDRDRRDNRSRRRSLDRPRSRESSRHRDRSRELERLDRDRLHSRSRSRDRDYVVKGNNRLSRSRSRSIDRDRDWDRGSYKKDDYRRHRDTSYDRSRGGSYEPRSPYDKRAPSYERKIPFDKGPYEKRLSPYDKRSSSYERRAPSYDKQTPYERKRHSPYSRMRGSSYGSRSPSRDDPRKRPRTPPSETRRPMSPREGEVSPINSVRSEDAPEYDRSGKQIPRIDFYHQSYRHKSSIRSPSQELDNTYPENQHSSLVTVPIVDTTPKAIESPNRVLEGDQSMDAEPFEPILSDEDICDDLDTNSYMEVEYDVNEYCGVEDIIKYYNPFKAEWTKYKHVNKITKLADVKSDDTKDITNATFDEICDASVDLFKIAEITTNVKKREQKFFSNTFLEIDNSSREDWVHQCEQLFVSLTNICRNTDIILRIFRTYGRSEPSDEFTDIYNLLVTFCRIGLNFEFALAQQQPTYKIRHMKCGIRLAETLMSHEHNGQVMKILLNNGINIPMQLIEVYSKEYMALSIRLMILKALNACLSSKESIDHFMQETVYPKFDKNESDNARKLMNGYQALIRMMQANPLGRVKFSLSALIKKLNVYEVLKKLHDLVLKFNNSAEEKNEDAEFSESEVNFIVDSFQEILYMYRSQCFHLSQPKRFLPVSAQFEISKECSNEILLQFFDIHRTFEVCLYLLTCPTTSNNLIITSPIHDLVFELVNSYNGLKYLYKNMEMSELLFKVLEQPCGQQNSDETLYPHDSTLSNHSDLQIVGLELAYRLKALYYLHSISDLQAGKIDENELIDRLQCLYCLSFGSIGKTAVPNVIVMNENSECLMEVFENDLKGKSKNDSPSKQKSPAKGYAIELIVSAVRYAANVPFLKKYGQRLINVSKEHDRFEPSVSSVLQEVIPYLKPVEKPNVLSGEDLVECVEILKGSLEHSADLPGELMTCLRILRHFCISDYEQNVSIVCETPIEEYVELKYKYNLLQLFSLDGVAHICGILDRLATHFDQPSMHTSFFASVRGLQLAQMLLPCLRLLDEMLARVVRCRGPRFRDLTAAPIILKTYGIAKTFPVGCIGYRTAAKAAEAAVRALLSYAQPIADDANDGDSIRRGPWTSLCSEVISYIMTAPYTFVPGLLIFSELLPLPLPMQTKAAPSDRELADAANERRMWSAHLHALSNDLTDMIQIICMSTYRPVVHMLRRVCVQIADLAPNTSATVAKAAVGAVMREMKDGEPANTSVARVLGFLACLVSHAPVKCAVLYTMSSGTPKSNDIQTALCNILSISSSSNDHLAAQEYAAHILAAFCDVEVTLTPLNDSIDTVMANSLPNKDALAVFLDATACCLESTIKTCSVASSVLRAYFVLTEHEFGFLQFRKFVTRKKEALGRYFKWALEGSGEDRTECLNLYVDLIKILKAEDGEGPVGRKSSLTLSEMADMIGYSPNEEDHPVMTLEKVLKDRNADELALSHTNFLISNLQKLKVIEELDVADQLLPSPEPLVAQFAARHIYVIGDSSDERLTTGYWLNVPSASGDDVNDTELMSCDIMEVANAHVSGGGEALAAAVRRLAGCLDTRPEALPCDDKRPAVALSRLRAEGGADAFRSRPPNTSRPPSLHVDDFTALHAPYTPRGGRRGAGAERGRFGAQHAHYRHLGRGAWEMGGQHFGHFPPNSQYMMGMGWGGARMQRGPRHRSFMR